MTTTPTHINRRLGRAIREHRVAKGLTQTQLADALDSSTSVISRWERGHTDLTVTQLRKLAQVLEIPEYWKLLEEPRDLDLIVQVWNDAGTAGIDFGPERTPEAVNATIVIGGSVEEISFCRRHWESIGDACGWLHDLDQYRRGKPMTMGELRALPEGAVVWAFVVHAVLADRAFRAEEALDGGWFDDEVGDEEPAESEWATVFHAVAKGEQQP